MRYTITATLLSLVFILTGCATTADRDRAAKLWLDAIAYQDQLLACDESIPDAIRQRDTSKVAKCLDVAREAVKQWRSDTDAVSGRLRRPIDQFAEALDEHVLMYDAAFRTALYYRAEDSGQAVRHQERAYELEQQAIDDLARLSK